MILFWRTIGVILFTLAMPFAFATLAVGETYVALSAASDWCFGGECE